MTTLFEKFLTINDSPERIPFNIKNYSPKEIETAEKCIAIHESEILKLNKHDISSSEVAVAFANWLIKNNMRPDGFGGWSGRINTNYYGSKTEDLYKLFEKEKAKETDHSDINKNVLLKLKNRRTSIEIGKQYYWKRISWKPEYSGMITVIKEGGSHRIKGWQVRYVDDEKNELFNTNAVLPKGTYCTQFADDAELYEL